MIDFHTKEYDDILHYPDQSLIQSCLTSFSLTPEQVSKCSNYFILHWAGSYLASRRHWGSLHKDGIEYLIIYQDGLSMLDAGKESQLRLSFRKLSDMSYGYVLVKRSVRPY